LYDNRIIFWGAAGTASIIFFLRALAFMSLNDFMYYEVLSTRQNFIKTHNNNVTELYKRVNEIKDKINDGTINIREFNGEKKEQGRKKIEDLAEGEDRESRAQKINNSKV
jgi:hypothetical protein